MAKIDDGTGDKPADVALLDDKLERSTPSLQVKLAPARLAFHVAVLCVFVGAFTGVALWGVTLPETVYDKVGSSANADRKTDTYNFRSGLVMAFVEVVMGWWLDKVQPVYIVFLHNLLWSSSETSAPSKVVGRVRSVVLFVVPIVVVLTLGNSIRGFQASNSTVGYNSTMILDDFQKSQSTIEKLQAQALKNESGVRRPSDTVLKNAVRQQTTPFSFIADPTCTQQNSSVIYAGESLAPINVDDLASIAVVYGFYSNEWNTEVNFMNKTPDASYSTSYTQAQGNSDWPEDFDINDVVDLFLHGTVMMERAIANSERKQHNCSESDGRTDLDVLPNDSISTGGWTYAEDGTRICQGPASSLFTLMEAVNNITLISIDSVMSLITEGLNKSFPSTFALDETTVSMEKLSLTDQMSIEALTIDVVLNSSIVYGETFEGAACDFLGACGSSSNGSGTTSDTNASFIPDYVWSYYSTSFCGNTSCIFFDISNTFNLQKEVGVIPLVNNCSGISYDANYGGWYPVDCEKLPNQAVVYGIGSYIAGDTFAYGGIDGAYEVFGEDLEMYVGPYIVNPRRHIQFSFALLSWETNPVHEEFDAQCDVTGGDGGDCNGMWYQLPQTKRYLFAGKDVLPVDDIMEGDFHSPTPLVQLNAPSFLIEGIPTELEYLNLDNFVTTQWNASLNETLGSDKCSSLMETYLAQVEDNKYFLERPLEVMYTSVFFFFMQNAAVADLSPSSSSSSSSSKLSTTSGLLANVQLKGDRQLRRIALSIPTNSFWISFVGCTALIAFTFIILIFPTQRAEYFEPGTTTAGKYIALKTDADYPNLVYKKILVPVKNIGVDPPVMNAFRVESMTLVHRTEERTQHIEL
ncbi:unnamed protein product [Phytophthora fragariaefolia]|uniref:Unnamed protein product n=1 Tax=Phytophthora fragariaefolia TaxID=1490495 RepID=A0A9W7CY61_9STRA|nr:unnamed protein product [Phytophthora fragariaefolia]